MLAFEICALSDEGLPDESCWRRVLNYVTLTAARFQFIRLLVPPVELHDKCIGASVVALPEPISVRIVPIYDLVGFNSRGQA